VNIERHGVLFAVGTLRRLPVRVAEVARLDPRRREFFGRDRLSTFCEMPSGMRDSW